MNYEYDFLIFILLIIVIKHKDNTYFQTLLKKIYFSKKIVLSKNFQTAFCQK